MAGEYRFSFGPWNIHEGADPFGPTVRDTVKFGKKLKMYKQLGFEGVQFHDDDAVPDMDDLSPKQIVQKAEEVRDMLQGEGLVAEFVAPRLWEDARTIDGAYTSNEPACREYAKQRSRRTIDIADALDAKLVVLWLAREGTYIREAKDSKVAVERIVEAIDDMLAYNPRVKIAIEPSDPAGPTTFRRHSSRLSGAGLRWVAASGIEGATEVTISLADRKAKTRPYTVSLHFAEPGQAKPGERVFSVGLQGATVLENLDAAAEAGAPLKAVVKTFGAVGVKDKLTITLTPSRNAKIPRPILCGVEVAAEP